MNTFMKAQINNVLVALKSLDQSIEMAAKQDDGIVTKEEKKQIKKIRKAIRKFQEAMQKL